MGATFQLTKNYASGFCNRSADTPFTLVSAPQGPQDAPGLHLLVPGVGGVGATFQVTNNLASGFCNRSIDTTFILLSAPQGPKDAPGLHLLVSGVGGVGATFQITNNSASGFCNQLLPLLSMEVLLKSPRMHLAYTF